MSNIVIDRLQVVEARRAELRAFAESHDHIEDEPPMARRKAAEELSSGAYITLLILNRGLPLEQSLKRMRKPTKMRMGIVLSRNGGRVRYSRTTRIDPYVLAKLLAIAVSASTPLCNYYSRLVHRPIYS